MAIEMVLPPTIETLDATIGPAGYLLSEGMVVKQDSLYFSIVIYKGDEDR